MLRIVLISCIVLVSAGRGLAQLQNWEALEVDADTLLGRNDYEGALKLYTKCIDISKTSDSRALPLLYKRAVCYYYLNEYQPALDDINKFIDQYPVKDQARLLRAFIYKGLDDAEHQISDLTELLVSQPESHDLLAWRGTAYLDKNQYDLAKKDLLGARASGDDAETEMLLGMAYYYGGQPDSALVSLNQSIQMNATYLPPYLYAGYFCMQQDEYQLSLKYLDVALKIEPSNTSALFYKGIALVEMKEEKEGCRYLTRAFKAGEDDAGDYLKEYCYGEDE